MGRLLSEAAEFNTNSCNTYDAYVFQKVGMLRNLRANWEEADLVELIIHGIKERDVQTTAMNLNFRKISELLTFLGTLTKPLQVEKRLSSNCPTDLGEPSRKRFRENPRELQDFRKPPINVKCYRCGKSGHVQRHCTFSTPSSSKSNLPVVATTSTNTKVVNCSFCAKSGHDISNCFTRQNIKKRKKVNFCSTGKDMMLEKLKIDGKDYRGIIDTGVDYLL